MAETTAQTHSQDEGVRSHITRAGRLRGLRVSVIASCFGMLWFTVALGVPITMFMECLGAKAIMIGAIVTIQQIATVLQIPGALCAEGLSQRKHFWAICALLHRLVWFIPAILAFSCSPGPFAVWSMIAVVVLSSLLAQLSSAPWFSWMADLVPADIRGRFWGIRQSLVMAASLLALAVTGWVLDLFPDTRLSGGSLRGYGIVFLAGAVFGCLDILIHWFVPEPEHVPNAAAPGWIRRVRQPFIDPDFRFLTFAFGAWLFSVGLVGSFGVLYLTRHFGVTYRHLSAITIAASVGTIVSSFLLGRLMDLIGARAFGASLMLVAPVLSGVWFCMQDASVAIVLPLVGRLVVPQSIAMLLLVNVVAGGFYGGVGLCQMNLLGQLVPQTGRTMGMAVHWTIVGVLGASGPIVGGLVTDWFQKHPIDWVLPWGTELGFIHVLILLQIGVVWFLAVPLLLRVRAVHRELPVRLLVGNPLRAAAIINELSRLTGAVNTRERVQAVRQLGKKRTNVAVADLIEKLEDPSSEVREEAAFALGAIGTQDAVNALVDKLEDPNSDLAPQIARSLRQTPDPRSVDALVRRLDDGDRETMTESARTLGTLGDRRASKSLLRLLEESDDDKVVSASSEALARLGEMAAIHSIIPRMKQTRNPVLKRSLAMAVGDLLGEHDGFYRVFVQEETNRGSAVPGMLATLRRAIDGMTAESFHDQGQLLLEKTRLIEEAYEEGDMRRAAAELFWFGLGMAALRYGIEYGDDARAFIDELIWRDQGFGVGVWYLHMLYEEWENTGLGKRDWADVLLGIYVISQCRDS